MIEVLLHWSFVRSNHQSPVDISQKDNAPVVLNSFQCHDVIMQYKCNIASYLHDVSFYNIFLNVRTNSDVKRVAYIRSLCLFLERNEIYLCGTNTNRNV